MIYLSARGFSPDRVSVPSVSFGAVGTAEFFVEGALRQPRKMKRVENPQLQNDRSCQLRI